MPFTIDFLDLRNRGELLRVECRLAVAAEEQAQDALRAFVLKH